MPHQLLGIGLTGTSLTDLERRILRDTPPYAVVLFGRNIAEPEQLRELVREVKATARRAPLMMIDEEGGRVDRLRALISGLPSAEAFAEGEAPGEMAEWSGRVIGNALRYFDIEVDLAPVVDIRGEIAPKGLERRTFGNNPDDVVDLAGAFLRGLHAAGTASCLKHFPGIGRGTADSHYGQTIIDATRQQLVERDLVPFTRLGNEAGAIMIGHGTYPLIDDSRLPATLSRCIATDLLRNDMNFEGLAVSDDMEMHAVSDLGSYESIAQRALMAGNDVMMFASHIERIPDIEAFLRAQLRRDGRFDEAVQRAERYRKHVEAIRHAGAPPAKLFDEIRDDAARFVAAFTKTRMPEAQQRPKTGPTGREEWT